MARPREKTSLQQTSAVFQHKCGAEQEKLQQLLAVQLRKDLSRLFEEEMYTDLMFHIKGQDIKVHKFILKARARRMYEKLVKLSTCPNDSVLTLDGLDPTTVRDFLRKLYTTENVVTAVEEFDEHLSSIMLPGLESCEKNNSPLMGSCSAKIEEIQRNDKPGQESPVVRDDGFGSVIDECKSQENAIISENKLSQDLGKNNRYLDQATVCDNDLPSGDDISLMRNVNDIANIVNIIEIDTDETKWDVAGNLQNVMHQKSDPIDNDETKRVVAGNLQNVMHQKSDPIDNDETKRVVAGILQNVMPQKSDPIDNDETKRDVAGNLQNVMPQKYDPIDNDETKRDVAGNLQNVMPQKSDPIDNDETKRDVAGNLQNVMPQKSDPIDNDETKRDVAGNLQNVMPQKSDPIDNDETKRVVAGNLQNVMPQKSDPIDNDETKRDVAGNLQNVMPQKSDPIDNDETKRDVAGNLQNVMPQKSDPIDTDETNLLTLTHQKSSQNSDGETSTVALILKGMKSESPDIQNLEQSHNCLKLLHKVADTAEMPADTAEMPADSIKSPDNVRKVSSVTRNISIPKKEWKENSEGKNTLHTEEKQDKSDGDKSSLSEIIKVSYNIKVPYDVCSQLGEDLLRAFLQEVDCDCNVSVMKQEFLAHRCILAARSTYFEAMLGGGWIESGAGSITLEGITPGVMEQSLLYLYGGVSEVSESCTLGELIMMADMYGMEGLKEIVSFNLRMEYCHFFHRPCAGCIAGVPEALTLAMMYNLEDLNQKCVKWISKHMAKVWPTKSFAYLPQEVLEYCCNHAILELSVDNVIEVMLDCRILNDKTPHLKWTETIFDMIIRLMDATIEFSSQHFLDIITSKMFRDIDKQGMACNLGILEDIFGSVIRSLSPEVTCQTYLSLHRWQEVFRSHDGNGEKQTPLFSEDFEKFLRALFAKCENHLKLYIHQAAHTAEWDLLTKDMQTSLMKAANYVCIDNTNRGRVAPPKLSSMQKQISATSLLSLKEYFDQHFVRKDTYINKKSKAAINQDAKSGSQAYSIKRKQSSHLKGQTTHSKSLARPKTAQTGSQFLKKQDSVANSDKQRQLVMSGNQSQNSPTAILTQIKAKQQRQEGTDTRTGRMSAEGQSKQYFKETKSRNTSKRIENQTRFASDSELSKKNLIKSKQDDFPSNESTAKFGDVRGNDFEDDEKNPRHRKRSLSVDAATFVQPVASEIIISESMIDNFTNRNQSGSTLPKLLPIFDIQFSVPQEGCEDL